MEHTKGKWEFIEEDFTIRTKDFSSNAGMGDYKGVIIAHLDSENWRGVRSDSISEKKANAKLIAAAPDLLTACENFRKGWSHFCDCIDFGRSNLDAEAIRFMNEVPGKIEQAAISAAKS